MPSSRGSATASPGCGCSRACPGVTTVADTYGGRAGSHAPRPVDRPTRVHPGCPAAACTSTARSRSRPPPTPQSSARRRRPATRPPSRCGLASGRSSPVRPGRIAGIMKDSARSIALSQGFFEGQPTSGFRDKRIRTVGSYGNPLATPVPSATTGSAARRAEAGGQQWRDPVLGRRSPGGRRGHQTAS